MGDLFDSAGLANDGPIPLAERMRPASLAEIVGQDHLLGEDGFITHMLASGSLSSVIFWGPPGSGKTTLARLLAGESDLHFTQLSAIFTGVRELREEFAKARERRRAGLGTLLFIDEIHRFNKSQQDSFLPLMEEGTIILVGATTENPSFSLNAALLSRASVLVFRRLDEKALERLLERAESHIGRRLPLAGDARHALLQMADGDGRALFNLIENVMRAAGERGDDDPVRMEELAAIAQRRAPLYDRGGDGHYNLISALHKSVRGSDPQAALYWLARMLAGGEDPLYIARRLVRMAAEDIGLADPNALLQANAAREAFEFLGSPEGELALAQAVVYLATSPKSNAVYSAFKQAMKAARSSGSLPPPKHILNAPTSLMKDEGYGQGYQYDHDCEDAFSGQRYFPEGLAESSFYQPVARGHEREIIKRLEYWQKLRRQRRGGSA